MRHFMKQRFANQQIFVRKCTIIAIDLSDYAAKRKRNRADCKQSSKQITSHNQQQNQQNQVKQEKH